MRLVVALGGNALLQRSDRPDEPVQREHVRAAARQLAPAFGHHEVVVCHGNGPQIGRLALESATDPELSSPFALDSLGAQTQGMIGYWLTQELANAGVRTPIAALVTQTLVEAHDPAFERPTKFIGRGYGAVEAAELARERNWSVAQDGASWRRVVASPDPLALVELPVIEQLLTAGTTVICAGGGGVPVVHEPAGGTRGVEAVVDKDLTAALLAQAVKADRLVLLTDVDAVKTGFGTTDEVELRVLGIVEPATSMFARGSMGPKVDACRRFVVNTGGTAVIGALRNAAAVIAGESGTIVRADAKWAVARSAP